MLGGGTVYDINIIYLLYIYYPILFTIGLLHQKKNEKIHTYIHTTDQIKIILHFERTFLMPHFPQTPEKFLILCVIRVRSAETRRS